MGEFSGPHGAAKRAGLRKEDILVEVDEITSSLTESEMLGRLLMTHPQKADLKGTVLRGRSRVDLGST